MAAFTFTEQQLYCGRYARYDFSIYDAEERPVAITSEDVVRAKLSVREGDEPVLDISSDAAEELDGGSLVHIEELGDTSDLDPANWTPASGYVAFEQEDTAELADDWTPANTQKKRHSLELSLDDAADGRLKPFGRGSVVVHRSPGGNTGT